MTNYQGWRDAMAQHCHRRYDSRSIRASISPTIRRLVSSGVMAAAVPHSWRSRS